PISMLTLSCFTNQPVNQTPINQSTNQSISHSNERQSKPQKKRDAHPIDCAGAELVAVQRLPVLAQHLSLELHRAPLHLLALQHLHDHALDFDAVFRTQQHSCRICSTLVVISTPHYSSLSPKSRKIPCKLCLRTF